MNSHNFYTYVLKYIFFEFVIKSQKLQAIVFAWENLQWGFCDVGCHLYFVAVLHLSFFFIHIFFSTSSLTLPWTLTKFLQPFCTFSPAHPRVTGDTFIFNYSVIFLPRALRFWVGIFYPQAFFTLSSFPTFGNNLLLSRLPWEPSVISRNLQGFILIFKTQTRPICLFDSQ